MEQLIPVIHRLQDVFNAIGSPPVDLPQVVVIGSQSSGKSSVLENIVGRDFLPRGTGVVTRCPLVLQLHNIPQPDEGAAEDLRKIEWGEFLHRSGKRYYDFNDIRNEIARETERLTGKNSGISRTAIFLKIYSPYVLNLTLVDLPGITKVPIGDQPSDIEAQIRTMCIEYISNPNALILAVTPANADVTNSDALKIAREVDVEGVRSIGVLTKIDLMDPGTDCLDVLQRKVIPLRQGFVGVVNRSQKDINSEVPIREALRKEQGFFSRHKAYKAIAHKMGTGFLCKKLNMLLINHIKQSLPSIKAQITRQLMFYSQELEAYGEPVEEQTKANQGGMMLSLISRFAAAFCDAIDGKSAEGLAMNELYGGARIRYIFEEIFSKVMLAFDPFDSLSDDDIRCAIENATGPSANLFVSEGSFQMLVRRQIRRLEEPGLRCVELVYEELLRSTVQCVSPELRRFGELREKIVDVVNSMLRRTLLPTQTMISNLIHIELAHINTKHPDFINPRSAAEFSTRAVYGLSNGEDGDGIDVSGIQPGSIAGVPARMYQQSPQGSNGLMFNVGRDEHRRGQPEGATRGGGDGRGSGIEPDAAWAAERLTGMSMHDSSHETTRDGYSGGGGRSSEYATPSKTQRQLYSSPGGHSGPHRRSTALTTPGAYGTTTDEALRLPPVPTSIRTVDTIVTQHHMFELTLIKTCLASYFNVVRKNFLDLVPKTIMCFLVNHAKEHIQSELVRSLYAENKFDDLLRETDDIAQQRRRIMEIVQVLQTSLRIVDEVREFTVH